MDEIVIRPPSAEKPGFLRRLRKSIELQNRLGTGGPRALEELIDFVVAESEIEAPPGADVREALLDLNRAQWIDLLNNIAGRSGLVP